MLLFHLQICEFRENIQIRLQKNVRRPLKDIQRNLFFFFFCIPQNKKKAYNSAAAICVRLINSSHYAFSLVIQQRVSLKNKSSVIPRSAQTLGSLIYQNKYAASPISLRKSPIRCPETFSPLFPIQNMQKNSTSTAASPK